MPLIVQIRTMRGFLRSVGGDSRGTRRGAQKAPLSALQGVRGASVSPLKCTIFGTLFKRSPSESHGVLTATLTKLIRGYFRHESIRFMCRPRKRQLEAHVPSLFGGTVSPVRSVRTYWVLCTCGVSHPCMPCAPAPEIRFLKSVDRSIK